MKKLNGSVFGSLFLAFALIGCTPDLNGEDGEGGGNPADDNDGDGYTPGAGDCNDNNAQVYPGRTELCNGMDDNCNGQSDEGLSGCNTGNDNDGDGYTVGQGDCDDNNNKRYPGCAETCNGMDDDCDGQSDEGGVCDCDGGCSSGNGAGNSSGNGSGSGSGNGATTGSGGTPPATCTVTINWSNMRYTPTTSPYVFGEIEDEETAHPIDGGHWAALNQCVPGANGSLCQMTSNGNGYSCSFSVPNGDYLQFVVSSAINGGDTGCQHSFDTGCWAGGGNGGVNGAVTVNINGAGESFGLIDNADDLDDAGGRCYGLPSEDPLCCKQTADQKVTQNAQLQVTCN